MWSCWWQWNSVRPVISGREVHFDFAISLHQDHVLHHARGLLAVHAGQFENVAMQMHGMRVVGVIVEGQTVSPSL